MLFCEKKTDGYKCRKNKKTWRSLQNEKKSLIFFSPQSKTMEKFKQYFHPFNGAILSINELKSIETAYKQNGSVGTFDDYVKNDYFAKPGKLYPTLEKAVSAQDTNYKVLNLSNDDDDKEEDLLDEYDNVIAKQSKIPVLERNVNNKTKDDDDDQSSDEDKPEIPVLERKINSKIKDESSDEDEEGIPYLKKKINATWDDEEKEARETELMMEEANR